jgi:hypothetical protein
MSDVGMGGEAEQSWTILGPYVHRIPSMVGWSTSGPVVSSAARPVGSLEPMAVSLIRAV